MSHLPERSVVQTAPKSKPPFSSSGARGRACFGSSFDLTTRSRFGLRLFFEEAIDYPVSKPVSSVSNPVPEVSAQSIVSCNQ